jgi:hypothetical protein
VFKFVKKLNKSSIGISGCFFSLPLFKIFQYSFGSDVFRKNYRKLKRKFKKERTETLKQKVKEAEKHHANTLDKNSKNYWKKMREELKNLKTSDPKEYWKILNRGREKKQPDVVLIYSFIM